MPFKKAIIVASLCSSFLASSQALALQDFCTPKLESYIKKTQKTVDSKYVPDSKKATAQKVLDKIKASRNATNDCVLVDKLLP